MSDIEVKINLPVDIEYIQAIEKAIDSSLSGLGFSRSTTSKTPDKLGFRAKLNYNSFFKENL